MPVYAAGKMVKKEPFVYIDLEQGPRTIKKGISHGHLTCIKKAAQSGLTVQYSAKGAYLKIFLEFYSRLIMKKTGKNTDIDHFRRFYLCLKDDMTFVIVKDNGATVAVSMLLKNNKSAFLAYGGMSKAGYEKFAKHLMIYQLMFDLKKDGMQKLVLGTGHEPYDPIYRFKRGFTDKDNYILTYEKKY